MPESKIAMINGCRNLGKIMFLTVRCPDGKCQIILKDKSKIDAISSLHLGSLIKFCGELKPVINKNFQYEAVNPDIDIIKCHNKAPSIDYSKLELSESVGFRLDNISLSLRSENYIKKVKFISDLCMLYMKYMQEKSALFFITPSITTGGTEGGADLFEFDYFSRNACLVQSGQLFKQIMLCSAPRVFSLSTCFRSEKSHTNRHLSESRQFEYESLINKDWKEVIEVAVNFIYKASSLNGCEHEISSYKEMTFSEVKQALKKIGVFSEFDDDISSEEEREIGRYVLENYGSRLIVITHWPVSSRPFYSFVENGQTNTFDLILDGVEIASGGQRIHYSEDLKKSLESKGISSAGMEQYLDVFENGILPHAGFGMGVERLVMTLLKESNIREVTMFPSDSKRAGGIRLKSYAITGGEKIREKAFEMIDGISTEASGFPVKSLILKNKLGENFLAVCPLDSKIDTNKLKSFCNGRVSFEDSEDIKNKYGLTVGSIPPFGDIIGIPMIMDESVIKHDRISFATGRIDENASANLSEFLFKFDVKVDDILK